MRSRDFVYIGIIAVLFFLAFCNKPKTDTHKLAIPTVATQQQAVATDSAYIQRIADSLIKHDVEPALREAEYWEVKYHAAVKENDAIASDFGKVIEKNCPDSSGKIKDEFNKYVAKNKVAQQYCESDVAAKNKVISAKDKLLANEILGKKKLKASFDSAMINQTALTKENENIQPHNAMYAGVTAMGGVGNLLSGVGVNFGFLTKKGLMLEAGAMVVKGYDQSQFTVGVKKIIRMKKR